MSKNEKNSDLENRIEISLIIDDNNTTMIELDLKKATEITIGNLCASICDKYDLPKKIQLKLMNQIKKEIHEIKSSNKKEMEMGMVKRLYYESLNKSKEKMRIIEKEKKEKEEKLLREYNFTPRINKSSNKIHDRNYLKIEDRLYYDYKKSAHKKGFEKFFNQLQMNKNFQNINQNNVSDGVRKTMDKSSTNFLKQQSLNENIVPNNTSDDKIDIDFISKRTESKKFTFYPGSTTQTTRRNNFMNDNLIGVGENNRVISTLSPNPNSNRNMTMKQDFPNNIINNLKKLSTADKMEQTASFPITIAVENSNNNLNNINENKITSINNNVNNPVTVAESSSQVQNINAQIPHITQNIQGTPINQNNLKVYKTQKALIQDSNNPTLSTGNNFQNTFSQLINNDNPSPRLDQIKPSNNNTEYDLYYRKNNFGKQFTFSNNNITANFERKGSSQNNGNTYTEKYEKLIGKNHLHNNNGQSQIGNSSKATPYVENITENRNNLNLIESDKENKEINNSPNNFLFTLNPNDKNNMKELILNSNLEREPRSISNNKKILTRDDNTNSNLLVESYGIYNEKATTHLNKSSQTADNKLKTESIAILNKIEEEESFPKKLKEKKKSSTTRGKINTNTEQNNIRPVLSSRNKSKEMKTKYQSNLNNEISTVQVLNKQTYSTWYDRLHKSKEDFKEIKEEMVKKQLIKVCPFRPKISDVSQKIIKKSKSKENQQQFLERLSNSKKKTQIFKDSKLIFSSCSGNTTNSLNTFSLSRSKSLTSGRRNFNSNFENSISPTYATQISKEIFPKKLEEKEKDISKRNYASTLQSENVDSENNHNSLGNIYLISENNKYDYVYTKKSKNLYSSPENSKTEKSLQSGKKKRSLKMDKNLVEMTYQFLDNKQKANKLLQEKCNQSILKFKQNNLKELFEMILSGQDLNVLPNHIKEKLLIPVCNFMNDRNLDFNFQNFYMTADEILNNFF